MAIHYISPFSISKNIGGAINLAIESLVTADDDWVCLTDMDVMFLRPDSKKQIEEILAVTDFDLLTCLTNRLARLDMVVPGMFDETDILKHIDIANSYHKAHYGKVTSTRNNLAAMVLCFKVSTWRSLGRFSENTINFDSTFCIRAKNMGLKLGIMCGVYVFHLYRLGYTSGEAKNNYKHLLREN